MIIAVVAQTIHARMIIAAAKNFHYYHYCRHDTGPLFSEKGGPFYMHFVLYNGLIREGISCYRCVRNIPFFSGR